MSCFKTRATTCIVILLALMLMCARAAIADVLGGDSNSLFQRDKQVTSQCVACNISYLLETRAEVVKTGKTLFPRHSCDSYRHFNFLAGTVQSAAVETQCSGGLARHCPLWLRHQSILR